MASTGATALPDERGRVWGPPFRGAAIFATTEKTQYKIGEPIRLTVHIRNNGGTELRLLSTGAVTTYRVTGSHESGAPIQPSAKLKHAESSVADPGAIGRSLKVLAGGEEAMESFELQDLVEIDKSGVWYIRVLRKLMSWDDGQLESNTVRINVTGS